MNKKSIGTNAGIIWKLMSDNASWTYEELKEKGHLTDKELYAAIGWLARENKIDFEKDPEKEKVYLIINFYF